MHGINNHREYYSGHYFAELLSQDLKDTLAGWKALADEHPDSGDHREPPARLRALARPYFRHLEKAISPESTAEQESLFLPTLLASLGYPPHSAGAKLVETRTGTIEINLLTEIKTQSGAPALWGIKNEELKIENDSNNESDPTSEDSEFSILNSLFSIQEPPRWILTFSLHEITLYDRLKFPERRFLSFDLREIFNRRDEATFQATASLLHRDSICPADGIALLDGLDENSHKHAFAVSEDLKLAVVASVQDLANEAVYYIREVRKEGLFNQPTEKLEKELTGGCLRYLYRLLFCFYLEARPELGYLPIKSQEYLQGYRGDPGDNDFLTSEEARVLLDETTPAGSELTLERRQRLVTDTTDQLDALRPRFDVLAEERCQQLVEAHERFCKLVSKSRYQVVYPVLPMDVLGLYVLLPA
jgi:hypothetical protein